MTATILPFVRPALALVLNRVEGLAVAGFINLTAPTAEGREILSAIAAANSTDADGDGAELRDVSVIIATHFIDADVSHAAVPLSVHQLALLYSYVAVWVDGLDTPIAAVAPGDTRRVLADFVRGLLAREWRQRRQLAAGSAVK